MKPNTRRSRLADQDSASAGAPLGFVGLLQAAFLFCKVGELTAIADWSWWWVLSPVLGSIAAVLLVFLIAVLIFSVGVACELRHKRRRYAARKGDKISNI